MAKMIAPHWSAVRKAVAVWPSIVVTWNLIFLVGLKGSTMIRPWSSVRTVVFKGSTLPRHPIDP